MPVLDRENMARDRRLLPYALRGGWFEGKLSFPLLRKRLPSGNCLLLAVIIDKDIGVLLFTERGQRNRNLDTKESDRQVLLKR